MICRALWHVSPVKSEIREEEIQQNNDREISVRALYSLISQGTEKVIAQGRVPDSVHGSMKVPYMAGTFGLPVKYGYSLVGEATSGGDTINGKLVHLMHPHQDRMWVAPEDVTLLPDGLSPLTAALISNMETAVNGLWDAGLQKRERVLVLGLGLIGLLLSGLIRQKGQVELEVFDTDETRNGTARGVGLSVGISENYDVVFHTTGTPGGLQKAIDVTGFEGRIIDLSWYGDQIVPLKLGGTFHTNRKRIISSQVSSIPGRLADEWDLEKRKQLVMEKLKDPFYSQIPLEEVAFEDSPRYFSDLRNNTPELPGAVIKY